MNHQNSRIHDKAHEASRTMFDALQGMAETTINMWRFMGDVQRESFSEAAEATQAEFQLLAQLSAPHEFAYAQARLVGEYGQKYADSFSETVEFMARTWQEYGDRFEQLQSVNGDLQDAVKFAAQEGKAATTLREATAYSSSKSA